VGKSCDTVLGFFLAHRSSLIAHRFCLRRVSVLAYHQVHPGFELGVNSISPRVFDRQMRFLVRQGYTSITPEALIKSLSNDRPDVLPRRPILLTFDDGYESFYTFVYPILKKYGLTATVFIPAGYIGQPNHWDVKLRLKRPRHLTHTQIQTLAQNGIDFGSHGMFHRFLTHCDRKEAEEELVVSKRILENILQRSVHSYAYPYGSTNAETEALVESAGYRIAFGLDPQHETTPYRFPRMAIYRCDTAKSFHAKLGLLGQRRFWLACAQNRFINAFAYLNLLRRR